MPNGNSKPINIVISSSITLSLTFLNSLAGPLISRCPHLCFILPTHHLHLLCGHLHARDGYRGGRGRLNPCRRGNITSIISLSIIRQYRSAIPISIPPVFLVSLNCLHCTNPRGFSLERSIFNSRATPVVIHTLSVFERPNMALPIQLPLNDSLLSYDWDDRDKTPRPALTLDHCMTNDEEVLHLVANHSPLSVGGRVQRLHKVMLAGVKELR